jgi:hypothetical protein
VLLPKEKRKNAFVLTRFAFFKNKLGVHTMVRKPNVQSLAHLMNRIVFSLTYIKECIFICSHAVAREFLLVR